MTSQTDGLSSLPVKVSFKFKSVDLFELDVTDSEAIGEIRSVLNDHPYLKLHPNFKMTYKAKRVNEVLTLSHQIEKIEQSMVFDLQPDHFTNQTAEKHINQCAEFFLHPEFFLNEGFLEFNIMLGKTDFIHNMVSKQELACPEVTFSDITANNLQKLSKVTFLKEESSEFKFFKSLAYSRFNPISNYMTIYNDFFYLDFLSKEGEFVCISVGKQGCYANESSELLFNPKARSNSYFSLLELLGELSSSFKTDLETYVKFDSQDCHDAYSNSPLIIKNTNEEQRTFMEIDKVNIWTSSLKQLRSTFSEFKNGTNVKIYRDWNEEFQSYRFLPAQDTVQQLQKTKILRKVVKDFAKSAQEVAKAIVHNHFTAVNQTDKKVEECYVFNNFFITYAEDKLDWETPRSETTPSTFTNINSDLKNLQHIYSLDMNNVNVINTCAVDYLGLRLVVQTMITGILHFDQKTWNCYGSIDDGKTYNDNEEFAPIFEDLCKNFRLKTHCVFKDSIGKEYTIHGSPEVKGIKAGDGRKYVMDLMKLSPRDLNFERKKEDEGCLIRQELIRNYFFLNSFEEMYMKNQENLKKEQDNQTNATGKEVEKQDNGDIALHQIPETITSNEHKNENDVSKNPTTVELNSLEKAPENVEYFNPNIGSMIENEDDGLKKIETEKLKSLANFINENAIPFFKNELSSNPTSVPIDMESLVEMLHKYGINVRYLGQIYHSFEHSTERFFKQLFERIILIRSLRKYFRKLALNLTFTEVLHVVVHFLNLILGDNEIRNHIDRKNEPTGKTENTLNGNQAKAIEKSSKRKNKKKKTNKTNFNVVEATNEYLQMTSTSLFKEITDYAKTRYGADFAASKSFGGFACLANHKDKFAFLREFSRSMGLVLIPRNYQFSSNVSGFEYPLKVKDFINITPKVKCPNFQIEGLKYSYKNIENEMNEKNLENALNLLLGCQNLVLNTYGLFNNDFIFITSKIASLYFMKGFFDKAIRTQLLVVKVSERVFGIDHFSTGFSIIELSNYIFEGRKFDTSISLHTLAIMIFDLIGGAINPSSLLCLQEIQMLYTQTKKQQEQSDAMYELLKRNEQIFGETDEHLLFLLGKVAALKSEIGNFKEASILQARKSFILKQIYKQSENEKNEYAKKIIDEKIQDSEALKNLWVKKYKSNEGVVSVENDSSGTKKVKNGKN